MEKIVKLITADNVALLSVTITILIFIISRIEETRYKKHEDKKIQYLKLIEFMNMTMRGMKENNGDSTLTDEYRKMFFDVGSSLLLYGSKRIYRRYIFFREFATNSLVKACRYYKEDVAIYIMADILRIMRKEVGLSILNNIDGNEALAFFVNDISCNPFAKERELDAKFRIKMIRFELAVDEVVRLLFAKRLVYCFLKPIFAGILIIFRRLVVFPTCKLINNYNGKNKTLQK